MKQRWNHTPSSPEGEEETGLLEGRNAIQEALRSGRTIEKSGLPQEIQTTVWPAWPPRPGKKARWSFLWTGASWIR